MERINYGKLCPLPGLNIPVPEGNINTILLFTGIANTYPLREHVLKMTNHLEIIKFGDHHKFTKKDYHKIKQTFENIYTKNKILITTEKDAMRIAIPKIPNILAGLPIFYIPIETKIHKEFRKDFNEQIRQNVRKNSGDSSVY